MKTPRLTIGKWWPIYGAGLLACACVTAAAWLLAIGPSLGELHQRAQRLQELADRRHKAAKLSAALSVARRQQVQTVQAITQLDLHLQPAAGANTRLAALTRLAGACGLTVEEVRPGQTTSGPLYETVALSLAGTGGYPDVIRLLHRIHQEMRDMGLQSMDLTSDNGNVATPLVRFRLDFLWYAAPPQNTPAPNPVATNE